MSEVIPERELARVYSERGYCVVGSFIPYRIGSVLRPGVIHDSGINQSVYVVSETDVADHEEQCRMLGFDPPRQYPTWPLFYRVQTD